MSDNVFCHDCEEDNVEEASEEYDDDVDVDHWVNEIAVNAFSVIISLFLSRYPRGAKNIKNDHVGSKQEAKEEKHVKRN